MSLTKKQKEVYDFIKNYHSQYSYAPTQREIKNYFNFKSFGSVQRYLRYLKEEGLLYGDWNEKRGLKLRDVEKVESMSIPLLGDIAAGSPLLSFEQSNEFLNIPVTFLPNRNKQYFAMSIDGDSMIEKGILDGDTVICSKSNNASNGDIVAACIDQEVTLKILKKYKNHIDLVPANKNYSNIKVDSSNSFQVFGILEALWRQY